MMFDYHTIPGAVERMGDRMRLRKVAEIPCARRAALGCQALGAILVARRRAALPRLQHVAERGGEILRVVGREGELDLLC
jgi:hypothetical protein